MPVKEVLNQKDEAICRVFYTEFIDGLNGFKLILLWYLIWRY